jgi:hypothetical protein
VVVGTVVGVLPGIGPVGAMALLLPSTFALHPATALIMLAGIYYGAMYGGSTTSILVNVPGEAGSVVTLLGENAPASALHHSRQRGRDARAAADDRDPGGAAGRVRRPAAPADVEPPPRLGRRGAESLTATPAPPSR